MLCFISPCPARKVETRLLSSFLPPPLHYWQRVRTGPNSNMLLTLRDIIWLQCRCILSRLWIKIECFYCFRHTASWSLYHGRGKYNYIRHCMTHTQLFLWLSPLVPSTSGPLSHRTWLPQGDDFWPALPGGPFCLNWDSDEGIEAVPGTSRKDVALDNQLKHERTWTDLNRTETWCIPCIAHGTLSQTEGNAQESNHTRDTSTRTSLDNAKKMLRRE